MCKKRGLYDYLSIPGFTSLGPCEDDGSIFQWMEIDEKEINKNKVVILIRFDTVEPQYWVGEVYFRKNKIVNRPSILPLLDKIEILTNKKINKIDDFNKFVEGHNWEKDFKKFEISTIIDSNTEETNHA